MQIFCLSHIRVKLSCDERENPGNEDEMTPVKRLKRDRSSSEEINERENEDARIQGKI